MICTKCGTRKSVDPKRELCISCKDIERRVRSLQGKKGVDKKLADSGLSKRQRRRLNKKKRKLDRKSYPKDKFLASYEWRKLRMEALKLYGPRCMCCGATSQDGAQIHVDHIKPRRKYPPACWRRS